MRTRILTTLVVVTAAIVSLFGSGSAGAKPHPVPHIGILGGEIYTLGNHDLCGGAVSLTVLNDPAKRGHATVRLASRGMNGTGPGWFKNPVCKVPVTVTVLSPVFPFSQTRTAQVVSGPRPAPPIDLDFRTNAGFILLTAITGALNKPISEYYFLV